MKVGSPQLSDRGAPTLKKRKTLDTTLVDVPLPARNLQERNHRIQHAKVDALEGELLHALRHHRQYQKSVAAKCFELGPVRRLFNSGNSAWRAIPPTRRKT